MNADRSASSAYQQIPSSSGNSSDNQVQFKEDGNAFADGSFTNGGSSMQNILVERHNRLKERVVL